MKSNHPYREFVKDNVPKLRAANPGVRQQDIMKMLSQLWRIHKSK